MPEIKAFRGLRYNPDRFKNNFAKLIAPPYDVLTAEDKAALLAKHDCNIVGIDLPFVPPKSAGPDELYEQAAETLNRWRDEQTIITEDKPALYVYHQQYKYGGRQFTRKKFFTRMRIEEFGKGTVFPHEHTFGGPKEDRLKLMTATRCQLSAVFGLYSDPENAVSNLLDVSDRPADVTADLDGIVNRMWVVSDEAIVQAVADQLANRAVFIADGHHRYGTALNYRDQLLADGDLPMDHPGRFILIGLCAMEDPGAVILPTHRTISAFGEMTPGHVLESLRSGVDLREVHCDLNDPESLLPADSPDDLCVYVADGNKTYAGKYTQRAQLASLAPDQSPAWRELDVAYIHRYLIDELVTKNLMGGAEPTTQYLKLASKALETARESNGIALICKACTMAQLRAVSEAGDLMPQKSTYFYPKLATGLVISPLE